MIDSATPTIIRAPHSSDHPWFACRRLTAQDERLSWEARGVLWYILSKPDDWIILESDLMRCCGRDKVRRILRELEAAGYLQRSQGRIVTERGDTRFGPAEFLLTEIPSTGKPSTGQSTDSQSTGNQSTGSQLTGNPRHTYKEIDTDQQTAQTTETTDLAVVDPDLSQQQQQIAHAPEAPPNPALDDDPPALPAWSESEAAIIQAEIDRIAFGGDELKTLHKLNSDCALGLLFHVQQSHVANPAGLLVTMLQRGGLPAEKHLKRAAYVLREADGADAGEEPEEREEAAESSTPDASPAPAESITATGEPERGPEPAAPVGDGLDERFGEMDAVQLWRSVVAQVLKDHPQTFFADRVSHCRPNAYAHGVLTVGTGGHEMDVFTQTIDSLLSRLAGQPMRVQWFWPAPTGGGIEVADKLAANAAK